MPAEPLPGPPDEPEEPPSPPEELPEVLPDDDPMVVTVIVVEVDDSLVPFDQVYVVTMVVF